MKKNIYFLGLLLLAACANDDEPTGQQVQNTYPLTIEVTENPLIPDGEEGSHTRAAITTTSSLTTFNLDYVYGGEYSTGSVSVTNDNGTWTTSGSWPNGAGGDGMVNWYAYTDGTFNLNGGNPYISFSVDENAAATKDLLVAKTSGTWYGTNGNIAFTFDHACAALRFDIKKSTNLNAYTVSVSNVKLCKVLKSAKYYWGTNTWENYATPSRTEYTIYSGSAITLASGPTDWSNLNAANDYLFMIPQTLTAWDKSAITPSTIQCYLEIACTISYGGSFNFSGSAYIPFGATLVAGKKYDVKINVGKNSLLNSSGTKIVN